MWPLAADGTLLLRLLAGRFLSFKLGSKYCEGVVCRPALRI